MRTAELSTYEQVDLAAMYADELLLDNELDYSLDAEDDFEYGEMTLAQKDLDLLVSMYKTIVAN